MSEGHPVEEHQNEVLTHTYTKNIYFYYQRVTIRCKSLLEYNEDD